MSSRLRGKTGQASASASPDLAFPKSRGKAGKGVSDREAQRKAEGATRADVYVRVQTRDAGLCRVCARYTGWLHQHHIVFRSKLGPDSTSNLLSLCVECHSDVHGGRLKLAGCADQIDADGRLCGVEVLRQVDGAWLVVRTV